MGEKKWIAFQLLTGLVEAHSRHVYHGDIKTENVLVTSWNWVYLADFASFKPSFLPEDNPADYAFYFDTSARRSCYLAPERFYAAGDTLFKGLDGKVTSAMDIFSLGCTIAEIFLDGTSLFSLSQLLRYKRREYDPSSLLDRIEDAEVRSLVHHMIQLKPDDRYSAQEYLTKWRVSAFPEYFYSFLHFYCASLADPCAAIESPIHHVFLSASPNVTIAEADYRIDRMFLDFEQIANALGIRTHQPKETFDSVEWSTAKENIKVPLPYRIYLPSFESLSSRVAHAPHAHDGCLIYANIVCSSLRNCLYPVSKSRGIDLLVAFCCSMTDEVKLDRILPFLCVLISDENPWVRINALVATTDLLSSITSISPIDTNLFIEYLLPILKPLTSDSQVQVRATYAQCIGVLIETSMKFLELSQLFTGNEDMDVERDRPLQQIAYDVALHDLQEAMQEEVIALLIDPHPMVRRALLSDISRLCVFFGRRKANDILLSHMITYLNDPDWQLRAAFAEAIVSVGTFVGTRSLEEYILPLMVQALTDGEEQVVGTVLNSLTLFAELGLVSKARLKELSSMAIPLFAHPDQWIRLAAIGFVGVTAQKLPLLDVHATLIPMLKPFLKVDVATVNQEILLKYAKSPVSRLLYNQTVLFASKSGIDKPQGDLMERLYGLGMTDEDKEKLFMLKYFISKSSAAKTKLDAMDQSTFSTVISFAETGSTPHTVFLTIPPSRMSPGTGHALRPPSSAVQLLRESMDFRISKRKGQSEEGSIPSTPESRENIVSGSSGRLSGKRQSKVGSIGNYDLTVDQSPSLNSLEKGNNRWTPKQKSSNTTGTAIDGQEKYIRRVLEKKIVEMFPPVLPELGPKIGNPPRFVIPDTTNKKGLVLTAQSEWSSWRPEGTLVAYFPEHEGQINAIRVAQDHSYFATGSDDGTVKIWDCHRLHTNVANRARLTYDGHGGRVTSIACLQNRHSIASASDNGQIHISRVEYIRKANAATKYVNYSPVTALTLQKDYAILLDHFETDSSSLLVYGTARGKVCAMDLRTMQETWSFYVPAYYGGLTSMVMDKKHTWLLTGTQKGVLSLWDVRFQLCLKSWSHPSGGSINKLSLYPDGKGSNGKLVCMAVETPYSELSVWNVDTVTCTDIFCAMTASPNTSRLNMDMADDISKLYGDGLKALPPPTLSSSMASAEPISMMNMKRHVGVRSFAVHPEACFIVTGGYDRKLRFWDLKSTEDSYIFSGWSNETAVPRYSSRQVNDTSLHIEYTPSSRFGESVRYPTWSPSRSASGVSLSIDESSKAMRSPRMLSDRSLSIGKGAEPLHSLVSKDHCDAITDVALIQYPHPMIISGARDGVVKVWQ